MLSFCLFVVMGGCLILLFVGFVCCLVVCFLYSCSCGKLLSTTSSLGLWGLLGSVVGCFSGLLSGCAGCHKLILQSCGCMLDKWLLSIARKKL